MGTPVTPQRSIIYEEDVRYKKSVSEALLNKLAQTSNFTLERMYYTERVDYHGYFTEDSAFHDNHSLIYIPKLTEVCHYSMTVSITRNAGDNSMNFTVYDEDGVSIGNLFSTAPVIDQASRSRATVGRDQDGAAFHLNTTAGFTSGTINPTFSDGIPEKSFLKPYIVNHASRSFGLTFCLGLRPLE